MSIHPETLKVVNYPETVGIRISMEYHNWQKLNVIEEIMIADKVVKLAKMIDEAMKASELNN